MAYMGDRDMDDMWARLDECRQLARPGGRAVVIPPRPDQRTDLSRAASALVEAERRERQAAHSAIHRAVSWGLIAGVVFGALVAYSASELWEPFLRLVLP